MTSVAILSRYPELYSTCRLQEALRARGVDGRVLQPERCALHVQQGKFYLYYEGQVLPPPELVLPRFGSPLTQLGVRLLRQLAAQGSYCLNGGDAILHARDKFLSLQILAGASLPVPETWYLADASATETALAQLGKPLVSKLLSGSQGVGVNLAESRAGARALVDTLLQLQHETLLQRFLPTGEDYRVIVLGSGALAAMRRRAGPGEFRSNLHRAGTAERVEDAEVLARLEKLALAATAALDLDFAGVDLMLDEQGAPVILEVNPVPSLEGVERVSGIDIAGKIVDFALSRRVQASA
ncbi:MAG: RimK family alpha-L-glutamate ligase [Acidithiobacillus sp.]|nr:RimK family alpha-L-glutamate ligase [Acidithiobacillus sp.]